MKLRKAWMAPIFSCVVLAGINGSAKADVVNGGFETGSFSGWTVTAGTFSGVSTGIAHSGSFAAFLSTPGTPNESDVTLSQTLTTIAGGTYSLSFWLENDGGTPNDFSVSFGGTQLTGGGIPIVDGSSFGYTQFTFNVTAATTSTLLLFDVKQDPAFFDLDDVHLTATPLPAALPLFGAGLGLMGMLGWRRKHKKQGAPCLS